MTKFSKCYYPPCVTFPEGDEPNRVMEVHRQLGFPGACGFMVGTHVRWFGCPKFLTNSCKGKESYPSLGSMVVVDHNRLETPAAYIPPLLDLVHLPLDK